MYCTKSMRIGKEIRWKIYAKPLKTERQIVASGPQFRQKSMKDQCLSWWLKRERPNHEKVVIFPNGLRPLLGPKSEKNDKKKYGSFWDTLGQPLGTKKSFQVGSEKMSASLSRTWPGFISIYDYVFMIFYEFVRVLKLTQTSITCTEKMFFRKGSMYANHMIYLVERVCATSLRTGAWPKSQGRRTCVCRFIVFSRFVASICASTFDHICKQKMAPKMTPKSMPK